MAIQSFLVQVECEADEEEIRAYIEEAVHQWKGGNPDLDDPTQTIRNVLVQPVEVMIRSK